MPRPAAGNPFSVSRARSRTFGRREAILPDLVVRTTRAAGRGRICKWPHLCPSAASAVTKGDERVTSLGRRLGEGVALWDLDVNAARWIGYRDHDRVAVAEDTS